MQKVRKHSHEPGPQRVRAILRLLDELRRNDDIGINGPERNAEARSKISAPPLRLAQRILVTNQKRGTNISKQLLMRLMRRAAHDKGDVARSQVGFNVRQALIEEGIVPQVRMRKVGDGSEVDHQRQAEQIRCRGCNVYRMVVDPTLRPLHPVDDAPALGIGNASTPYRDTWVSRQSLKILRECRVPHSRSVAAPKQTN